MTVSLRTSLFSSSLLNAFRLAVCLALAAASFAAAAEQKRATFDIAAAPAAEALKQLASQGGIQLLYAVDAVTGVKTNAVKGDFTPREALDRMLAGTALTAHETSNGSLTVRKDASDPNVPGAAPARSDRPENSSSARVPTTAEVTRPPGSESSVAKEETVTLSPFEVRGDEDHGYRATDSLAGTRLRTSLKDIAASVSVVTKDMMDDLGVTNSANLLVYTTGTEVVGIGGNFSGSAANTYNQDFETQRESVSPNTRVRGLASADQTRNFFASPWIPMDAYNTQSVTINRGANAILFGFGSPAGIIETSLAPAEFKNRNTVQARFGSYGTVRTSLDLNRVVVKGKLAARISAVDETRKFEQDAAFREQKRLYGAAVYRPFERTTIRLNGETGKMSQRLPRTDPPLDSLSTWWWFGQPARNDNLFNANSPARTYQRANNLDGQFGGWTTNPGLIYPSAYATTPVDGFPAQATVFGQTYYYGGPRSSAEIERFVYNNPIGGFLLARQVLDRSVFDYRREMIDGPNNGTDFRFNTGNIAVEQLFLKGDAGIELVYDYQESMQSVLRKFAGYRGNNLFIDPNKLTNDGRPNPNYGRPVVLASGRFVRDNADYETRRATAFVKHDFRRSRDFLGKLLGVQTVTGVWTDHKDDVFDLQGWAAVAAPGWRGGTNGTGLGDRAITDVVYLGPSLAGAASPAGAHISGVRNSLVYPSTFTAWNTFAPTGAPAATTAWNQYTSAVYQYPDYAHLADTVTLSNNAAQSYAAVWQGNWWNNLLVSTAGWRHDEVTTAFGSQTTLNAETGARPISRPALVPGAELARSSFSLGVALHLPAKWLARVPGAPKLSLYYNDSQNAQITGARRNMLGEYFSPQQGKTKEIGIGLTALDEKISFRASWYETNQENITDDRITPILSRLATFEGMVLNYIPRAQLDAAGYIGLDSPSLSPTFQKYLKYYQFSTSGAQRSDGTIGTTFVSPPGTVEVTDAQSKGMEIEGVYNPTKNLRIAFNLAKQQAVRGDTSATFGALVEERLAQWKKPLVWNTVMNAWTGQSYTETNIINPLNTARLLIGAPASELRKWRANVIANYKFDRGTRLRGWAIGGAARWQDKVVLGYPVINPPSGMVSDIQHPYMGGETITYDGWLGYERKIFGDRIGWKLQLNVRNLLDDNLMIPVRANPVNIGDIVTHDNVAYRIGERRTWELTSTFSF